MPPTFLTLLPPDHFTQLVILLLGSRKHRQSPQLYEILNRIIQSRRLTPSLESLFGLLMCTFLPTQSSIVVVPDPLGAVGYARDMALSMAIDDSVIRLGHEKQEDWVYSKRALDMAFMWFAIAQKSIM